MWVLFLVVILFAVPAFAEENCPVKLQESQTQTMVVAQSRDQTEARLAQALRANRELGTLYDQAAAALKKAQDDLAALKPKEGPKP